MAGAGDWGTANEISGGDFRGPVFLGRDFIIKQAPAAPVALAQLPPLASGFTGRGAELAQVAGLLSPVVTTEAVVVSAVAGLAGVGKTTLAVHAAHAARSSGWFPGGVLFIDLHGYDPNPVQPGQALDSLLRALGVPGEHIPEGTEQRAGYYRSALAQVSGPVLIIADNASSEAQVRQLLPGPGPHRVLITSRHTLAGLGARLLDVTVLDRAAALELLDKSLRAARPGDDRISGGRAAGQLAEACGGLPLALRITAALLVADPALTAADLAEDMADEVGRLGTLRYDDGGGASAPSVEAAFELSYRQLDDDAARIFRLLPSDPGPDVSTEAAAQLAGWPVSQARNVLGRLTRAHLVEPGARGRWRMHDLVRLYASQVPGPGPSEREQAVSRLLEWYLRQADAADRHMPAPVVSSAPPEFTGRDDALEWLDAQYPNLIAAVTMAAATGRNQEAMLLPLRLSAYLAWRRRFDDWPTIMAISRESARQRNDKHNEVRALNFSGEALWEAGRPEEAITAVQEAVAICRETGDQDLEGRALNRLGIALGKVNQTEAAITAYQESLLTSRAIGDRHLEGTVLSNLGIALAHMRRFEEAIAAHQRSAAISRDTRNRPGEANALNNLGCTLDDVRRFEEASTAFQRAADIYREVGDYHGEGMALQNLGEVYKNMEQLELAAATWRKAAAAKRVAGADELATHLEQLAADTQA
jgi:tetratricopeptide (TPR) repeat protein